MSVDALPIAPVHLVSSAWAISPGQSNKTCHTAVSARPYLDPSPPHPPPPPPPHILVALAGSSPARTFENRPLTLVRHSISI